VDHDLTRRGAAEVVVVLLPRPGRKRLRRRRRGRWRRGGRRGRGRRRRWRPGWPRELAGIELARDGRRAGTRLSRGSSARSDLRRERELPLNERRLRRRQDRQLRIVRRLAIGEPDRARPDREGGTRG